MDPLEVVRIVNAQFNDRTLQEEAHTIIDPNVVHINRPTGRQLDGLDAFVQNSLDFIAAFPDVHIEMIAEQVNGNTVVVTFRNIGTFTGQLEMPGGPVTGHGNRIDFESQVEVAVEEGKIVRWTVDYDLQEFSRQLGLG
jgi:predicted ester cyclase